MFVQYLCLACDAENVTHTDVPLCVKCGSFRVRLGRLLERNAPKLGTENAIQRPTPPYNDPKKG